jgi:serine/threonine-protein kinase RsbW
VRGPVPPEIAQESAEDLYEHAPCGYLSTRPDGTIARVNATFLQWTGYQRDDLVGRRRFQELLTPGGRMYHETHFAPLLAMQGAVREIALEVVCADGRRLPVLVNAVLRRDAEGRPLLARTTIYDARDRQRYERELLAARRREAAARERTERLQRLTAALAGAAVAEEVADALLAALVEGLGARDAAFTVDPDPPLRRGPEPEADAARLEAPLVVDGRRVGTVAAGLAAGREATEADRAFVEACAGQAAQALERARLREQSERAARRWALLAEVGAALEEERTVEGRIRQLVDHLVPAIADAARVELGPDVRAAPPADERGAAAVLALQVRSRQIGTLVLRRDEDGFAADERPFLEGLAARAALALENAELYELEHDAAGTLQRSLLAGSPVRDPRFAVAARYLPAVPGLEVGGDWWDVVRVAPDRVGIVVGDVVGRGIAAAAAMGQLRSAVRALAGAGLPPGALLERLDEFVEPLPAAQVATVAYAELDLVTGRLLLSCAGHPPPAVMLPGAPAGLEWGGRGAPLAAYAGLPDRPVAELDLPPGTRLAFYTDGLVERRTRILDDGMAALLEELERVRGRPLEEGADAVVAAMLAGADAGDDVCLLYLELGRGAVRADRPA